MNALSSSQINSITKLIESMGEKAVFITSVEKQHKRKQRIEKRVIVITDYRVITLRSGIMTGYRVAREGMITDITYLGLDNTEKITLRFKEWDIIFHTLYTEQFVSTILNLYNTLSIFIPDNQRASVQVNPSSLSHSNVTERKPKPFLDVNATVYAEAMKTMYHVMCNKNGTLPLEDIETDMSDRLENGCSSIVIDNNMRVIDAQQCAAIIDTLQFDTGFTELTVKNISGNDVIIPALSSVLGTNSSLTSVTIDSIRTTPKTLLSLVDAFIQNRDQYLQSLSLINIPLTTEVIDALLPALPALTHLSVSQCSMNQSMMVHFFNTMKNCLNLTKSLRSLDISFNTLGPDGTCALAAWLSERIPSNLTSLNIAGTNVAWPSLISVLQRQELHITSLNISSNSIYDKVFCVLNPFISGGHITSLSIGNMKGDLSMVEGICGSLLLNSSMKETHLFLDDTVMDYRFQERLISLIAQSANLVELSLRNCKMDDVCISMLFDVLTKFPNCHIQTLQLDGNLHIPEVGKSSEFICNYLSQSKTIQVLSLSRCRGILISKIAEGLKASSTIQVFEMNDCNLMDDDIAILCDAVENHCSLRVLQIDGNNIMVDGFRRIHDMMAKNRKIQSMGFLRSLPEIERIYKTEDREVIKMCRRESFIQMMKNSH